jgi:hypothetical protein
MLQFPLLRDLFTCQGMSKADKIESRNCLYDSIGCILSGAAKPQYERRALANILLSSGEPLSSRLADVGSPDALDEVHVCDS